MDNSLWERVLIDWVNCLKLSNPIQKLDDLRDGLFFSNLHKLIKKSSEIDCDILTCIFDVLNEHYSEYIIPNKTVIHLSDLPKSDLCGITSLLMHYTIMHDRRDVLTSPLCYNLQEFTQVKIRSFLEKVQDKLNNEELARIINSCIQDNRSYSWISSPLSNSRNSPLQDVIKTPAVKSTRLFERDKEIAKLKAHLELVQEEKECAEKDLRSQIERNKKLEKQLSQKTLEISNLRSEVLELENRTPPHYRDKDYREMQKILRTKVDSLEQILEQSDKENLELREERDKERAQVKQLENRCKTWLEKFIDADKNLQSITENYKELQLKNENLKAHCDELEALLEELKPKSMDDSNIEESFQTQSRRSRSLESQCEVEDLAHSVVDIQLKEIQKENETIKANLEQAQNHCKQLRDEVDSLVLEKSVLSGERDNVELELQAANGKIEEFTLNYKQLHDDWKILTQEKNLVVKEKDRLITDNANMLKSIEKLNYERDELSKDLAESNKERKQLVECKKQLENELENLNAKLGQETIEKSELSEKLNTLTGEHEELILTHYNLQLENQTTNEILDKLKTENAIILCQLDELGKENSNTCIQLKQTTDKLLQIEESLKIMTDEKHVLQVDLSDTSMKLKESCVTNSQILERENILNAEKVDLEEKNSNMKTELDSLTKKCEGLILLIQTSKINHENVLIELDSKTESIERMAFQLKKSEDSKLELERQLSTIISENESLALKYSNLIIDSENMQKSIEDLKNDREELLKDTKSCKKEIEQLVERREQLEHEIKCLNTKLTQEITEKSELVDKLAVLNSKHESLILELNDLISEKQTLGENINRLETENTKLLCQIDEMTKEHSHIFDQLKQTTEKLLQVEGSLKIMTDENHVLQENLSDTSTRLKESYVTNSEHVENINTLTAEKVALEDKNHVIKSELETLTNKCEELTVLIEASKVDHSNTLTELDSKTEALIVITKEREMLKVTVDRLEAENLKLLDHIDEISKESSNIREQLTQMTTELLRVEDSLKGAADENHMLMKDLNETSTKLKESILVNSEHLESISSLTAEKTELEQKIHISDTELETLTKQFKEFISQAQTDKINQEDMLKELDHKILETTAALKETENSKLELEHEQKLNEKKIQQLEDTIKTLEQELNNKQKVEEEFESVKLALDELTTEKNALVIELEKVNAKNCDICAEKESLSDELDNTRRCLKDVQEETYVLSNKLAEYKEDFNEIVLARKELENQLEVTRHTIDDLKSSLQKTLSEKEQISTELHDLERNYEQMKVVSINTEEEKVTLLETVSVKEELIRTLEDKNSELLQKLEDLIKEKSDISVKLQQTEGYLEEAVSEKRSLENQLEDTLSKLCELSTLNSQHLEKLNIECSEKSCILNNLEREQEGKHEVEQKFKKLELEFGEVVADNKTLTEKLQRILADKQGLEEQLDETSTDLRKAIFDRQNLAVELEKITEERNVIINEKESVCKNLENVRISLNKVQEEANILSVELNKGKENCDQLLGIKNEMEQKMQEVIKEKCEIEVEFKKIYSDLSAISKEKDDITIERADFVNKCGDLTNNIDKINEEKEEILVELENKSRLLLEVSSQLNETQKDRDTLLTDLTKIENYLRNIFTKHLDEADKKVQGSNNPYESIKLLIDQIVSEKQHLQDGLTRVATEQDLVLKEKNQLQTGLEDLQGSYKELSKDMAIKTEALVLTEQDRNELLEKYNDLSKKWNDVTDKNKQLNNDLEESVAKNHILVEDLKALTSSFEQLTTSYKMLQTEKEQLMENVDTNIVVVHELQEKNKELSKMLEELDKEKSDALNELKITVESLAHTEDALKSALNDKTLMELEIKEISSKLEQSSVLNSQYLEKLKIVNTDKAILEEKIIKLTDESAALSEKCEEITKVFNDELNSVRIELETKSKLVLEISSLLEEAQSNNLELSEKLSNADALKDKLLTDLDQLEKEVIKSREDLTEKLTKCEQERDNVLKINSDLEQQLREALYKNEETNKDSELIISEKHQMAEELQTANVKYHDLEVLYKNIQLENNTLLDNLTTAKSNNTLLSDKLAQVTKSLESAVEDFANENKLITEKLNEKADVINKAILEKENLTEKLASVENELVLKNKSILEQETKFEAAIFEQMEIANQLQTENVTLSGKLSALSKENEANCSKLEDSVAKIAEMSGLLKVTTEEKDNLLQNYNEAEQKLVAARNEIETTKAELNKLTQKLEQYQLNTEQNLTEIQNFKCDIERLTSEKEQLEETIKKVVEEKTVVSNFFDLNNNELQKTQQERDDLLEALVQSNKEVSALEVEKADLLKEIEKLTKVKNDFSEQLDKVSQENADATEKLQNLLKKNFESSEENKNLQEKVDQLTEENAEILGELTMLSNDLEEKTKNVELLEVTCKTLQTEVDKKSEMLEKLSEEHKDIFDIVDRLSNEKMDMMKTIATLSEEKMNITRRVSDLVAQIEDLIQEKNKLIECLDLTDKELQKVKRDRNDILEEQTKIMKDTQSSLLMAHQSAIEVKNDLMKKIETAETEKEILRKQVDEDTKKIKDSYICVMTTNSKLELEIINLRKKIEDKNQKLSEYVQIKEAYEKLLEENNRLMTEVDTTKYKRSRDREEFVNLLKKEREEATARENKKVKEVRNEYEGKLEKMKEKMLKLYREEVSKEMMKVKAGQSESICLVKTIEDLRNDLFESQQKLHMLETERDMLRIKETESNKNIHASRESLRAIMDSRDSIRGSVTSLRSVGLSKNRIETMQMVKKSRSTSTSLLPRHGREVEKKTVTLPRRVAEIQETITVSRRTSLTNVPSMPMEDEDDDFNNKYLADLKAGHCVVGDGRKESNVRFSELAWRNSLLPPHLKSSYPAETQFVSPSKFKEDDLRGGNVDLDDSLSKLLPGDKPRQKKDFGTTTYKKPGPPTPSKNGGRLSLQGNEVQPLPLREQNERTPTKKVPTPSRIRALFMGKSNIKDNSENHAVTPRTRQRLSIFRKQR